MGPETFLLRRRRRRGLSRASPRDHAVSEPLRRRLARAEPVAYAAPEGTRGSSPPLGGGSTSCAASCATARDAPGSGSCPSARVSGRASRWCAAGGSPLCSQVASRRCLRAGSASAATRIGPFPDRDKMVGHLARAAPVTGVARARAVRCGWSRIGRCVGDHCSPSLHAGVTWRPIAASSSDPAPITWISARIGAGALSRSRRRATCGMMPASKAAIAVGIAALRRPWEVGNARCFNDKCENG
jgi:hypothetical protein